MRALGWTLVVAGLLFFATGYRGQRPPDLPRLTDEQVRRIAMAAERDRGRLLSELADRLPRDSVQVSLVQGVPNGPAMVLATENDSSGDETATHWPSPWPELNRFLSRMPHEAITIVDAYAGRHYVHHVYPANLAENQYLVITDLAARGKPKGWYRWIVLGVSLVLGAYLGFGRKDA